MEIILADYGDNWFATAGNNAIIRPHRLLKMVFQATILLDLRPAASPTGQEEGQEHSVAMIWQRLRGEIVRQLGTALYGGNLL